LSFYTIIFLAAEGFKMANFRDRVPYPVYRAWRFVKLNWRNLIVITIAYGSVLVGLWSIWQLFTSKPGGLTALYAFLALACGVVAYIAYTSKRGRFDYLLLDEDD